VAAAADKVSEHDIQPGEEDKEEGTAEGTEVDTAVDTAEGKQRSSADTKKAIGTLRD
jgi:hypothetical protein